jgi:2-keto-4-pentenoate hydratase/2-oxohepta-3-ene-1,7-dioic acid hydratase in catechol pathway
MSTSQSFALGSFESGGRPFVGLVLEGERVFELEPLLGRPASLRELVDEWDTSMPRLQELADGLGGGAANHELSELRPLPPLRPCGQIFQAAANYRQHVIELMAGAARRGDDSDGMAGGDREKAAEMLDERAANGRPFVFLGSAHAMVGAEDDVLLPFDSDQSDWELELAAVIGRPGRRLDREAAIEAIAGYTICNDLTSRDALSRWDAQTLGIDWLAGKNAPTFLPTGPLLVPAAHIGDPMDLRLRLDVNGRTMQDETTADMLFDIAALVSYVSTVAELRPGDIVLTGSPAGNGASHGIFLAAGDLIEATIEGLGAQRNRCVAEPAPEALTADAGQASR